MIERKYLDMLDALRSAPVSRPMEPLPGWFARRRPNVPAAIDVIADLPSGPVLDVRTAAGTGT